MKLRLTRMSGKPVSEENLAAYTQEFQKRYDEILAAHGPDMLTVHQELIKLDNELQDKWQRIEIEALPKSAKGWKKIMDKFQAPMMLARSMDNPNELVLVIMDEPIV